HEEQFARLAASLKGAVNEVVISFMQLYAKTRRNLNRAGLDYSFAWADPTNEEKLDLVRQLVMIASENGIRVAVCSQREFVVDGAIEARCVDARRLAQIAGKYFSAALRGSRKECGCFASRDIGEYDTCPHGCVYCYAVRNQQTARYRFRKHDPSSE